MGEFQVLAAVQYLDRGEVKDIAALLDDDVADVFRTCRSLERANYLEEVRPMTFRITTEGVDYLDGWVPPGERVGVEEAHDDGEETTAESEGSERGAHSGPLTLTGRDPGSEK